MSIKKQTQNGIKPTTLVAISDFKHYVFYGEKELGGQVIYQNGCYDFNLINWDNVKKVANGYYDYGSALCQIIEEGHRNASTIAWVLEKVLGLSVKYICHENDTLYMEIR